MFLNFFHATKSLCSDSQGSQSQDPRHDRESCKILPISQTCVCVCVWYFEAFEYIIPMRKVLLL